MSDQVTEIREALDLLKGSFDAPRLTPSQILAVGSLMRVAREHLDLLDSDVLIIRRDDPEFRACLLTIWERGFYEKPWDDEWVADFADALALSQVVNDG